MTRLAIAAALMIAASPVCAQTSGTPAAADTPSEALSEDSLRAFFGGLGGRIERAVAEHDWKGVEAFMKDHIADNANLAFKGSVTTGGPVLSYAMTLRGRDLDRMAALGMRPMLAGEAIGDYTASSSVEAVHELPRGEASALVRLRESGTLDPAALGGEEKAADRPETAPLVFESLATCLFRVTAPEGKITIERAACDTATTM